MTGFIDVLLRGLGGCRFERANEGWSVVHFTASTEPEAVAKGNALLDGTTVPGA